MSNAKKSKGVIIAAAIAVIMTIVSFVIYTMNIGAEGYYKAAAVPSLPLYTWLAVGAMVLAVVIGKAAQNVKGIGGSLVAIVTGLLQIAAPVLLAYCLINLISGRVEGLGYIYFSNADVAKEVQTAANLSSATQAIVSMVCYGVSMVLAMIASFFSAKKA